YSTPSALHSFPTRRSSDLAVVKSSQYLVQYLKALLFHRLFVKCSLLFYFNNPILSLLPMRFFIHIENICSINLKRVIRQLFQKLKHLIYGFVKRFFIDKLVGITQQIIEST